MEAPVTINVKCDSSTTEPEVPGITVEDVTTALDDNAIAVKCIDNKHKTKYFALDGTTVSLGEVTGNEYIGYQCDVTVTLDIGNFSSYLASYNEFTIPQKHSFMSPVTIKRILTMKNDANDGKGWYFAGEVPIATIDVTCASGETTIPAPEDETVNNLLGKAVIIDCTNDEANHENEIFSLIEDTYQIGEVYMADGIPHCDVTITAPDKYAAQYSHNTKTNHPLAPAVQESQAITLKYVNDEWAIDDDGTVYYTVACEDTSTEPTPTPTPTPTPNPTPTPDPGDDDNPPYNPPYIPPVDPDDSGVSDLLNTDDHIQYLFGYPEGTSGPENNMTRAEVAQMFYNLLLDQDVTITKTFDDVPANAWYAKAVNTLASLGVVSGVGNGDFEPERSITRAEFTSIAMKFAEGKTGGTNIFSDVKSTDWFYRAVVNSTQYGWIHGYGDGTFRPNNPITRVEVTAIVNNMLGREADVDFVTEHYDELNHFSDLAVSHWGYYHIVEATNDHDYTKPSSGENWTELN
ncbi:MAG: S-layer homology domain-containing protein [Acutalibacter sp.]